MMVAAVAAGVAVAADVQPVLVLTAMEQERHRKLRFIQSTPVGLREQEEPGLVDISEAVLLVLCQNML